ncbi:TniQ family protein [Anaeroarcus burkinensis]|uniref:TniQ family protein n=1 Tax=Anaeroarcus burkinensis TaxID=82376 RepID=UPI0003F5A2F1|nr:TniQ family protein [Anaeroarcus burkinensis]
MWPLHLPPQDNELLSSWLFRLSRTFDLKVQTFSHCSFPNYQLWNRDIDKNAPDGLLRILSDNTGLPFSTVKNTTLATYEGYLFSEPLSAGLSRWFLPLGIYHRTRKRLGLQFCPQCFTEDPIPYYRRSWRIITSTLCPRHKIQLNDCCPNCKAPVVFFRIDYINRYSPTELDLTTCFNCGFDLRNAPSIPICNQSLLRFSSKLTRAQENGYVLVGKDLVYSVSYFLVIYQLLKLLLLDKYSIRLRNYVENKTKCYLNKEIISGNPRVNFLSLYQRQHGLFLISWLLKDWPINFLRSVTESGMTRSRLLKDMLSVPYWFDTVLSTHTNKKAYTPSSDEIQAVIHWLEKNNIRITKKSLTTILGVTDSSTISCYLKARIKL